eukprot:254977-Pyramimonas_sp.AAC.1
MSLLRPSARGEGLQRSSARGPRRSSARGPRRKERRNRKIHHLKSYCETSKADWPARTHSLSNFNAEQAHTSAST